jgi:hypothetical protein
VRKEYEKQKKEAKKVKKEAKKVKMGRSSSIAERSPEDIAK